MSILALILILLIALAGAELFAKSTLFIAFTLVFAFVAGFISLLVANTVPDVVAKNISGPLQANFAENMALPAPNFKYDHSLVVECVRLLQPMPTFTRHCPHFFTSPFAHHSLSSFWFTFGIFFNGFR